MTVFFHIFFAKIVEQHFATAHRRLGISGRFQEQLSADILLGHGFAFHKFLQFLQVFVRIKRHTKSLATVSTCATCLLIIAFKTLWDVVLAFNMADNSSTFLRERQ